MTPRDTDSSILLASDRNKRFCVDYPNFILLEKKNVILLIDDWFEQFKEIKFTSTFFTFLFFLVCFVFWLLPGGDRNFPRWRRRCSLLVTGRTSLIIRTRRLANIFILGCPALTHRSWSEQQSKTCVRTILNDAYKKKTIWRSLVACLRFTFADRLANCELMLQRIAKQQIYKNKVSYYSTVFGDFLNSVLLLFYCLTIAFWSK